MLSWLWTGMVLISILCGILFGTAGAVSSAAMEGATTAIELSLALAGPMCLWCGVGELMRRSGLRENLSKLLSRQRRAVPAGGAQHRLHPASAHHCSSPSGRVGRFLAIGYFTLRPADKLVLCNRWTFNVPTSGEICPWQLSY